MTNCVALFIGTAVLALFARAAEDEAAEPDLLKNPSFEEGVQDNGVPVGWGLYGGLGPKRSLEVVELPEGKAVLISDSNSSGEVGLVQSVSAEANAPYLASVKVKAVGDASPHGAYLQLRFLPSNEYVQNPLMPGPGGKFRETQVGRVSPPGTTEAVLYLYTHASPTPQVVVADVRLTKPKKLPKMMTLTGKPAPPEITELKDLHIDTDIVKDGAAVASIIAPATGCYDTQANEIVHAVEELTGVKLPVLRDDAPEAGIPLECNVIVLGNRSTNRLIEKLYNRYFTLLDLRYPGPEGYVVRSLHNPFGNGHNAIFVGGSDLKGVEQGTRVLIEKMGTVASERVPERDGTVPVFSIGRLAEIQLGKGIEVPTDLREFEVCEASAGYRSVGYFGWNSISKRMAMYYMTGDEFHAREALRLAFPDEQAKKEIAEIDGERIENKDDPLGGPYHYNAHMMILFWDLIEESPVFTDEERLRVTRAFTRQLNHPGIRAAYIGPYGGPPGHVGSRHGQWTAISLYSLGRYFMKDYDDPIWEVCAENGMRHFRSLHEDAWVSGENDNLFWYNTAIAPIFTYMLLTGDRAPLENGVIATLLRGQEILVSGRVPDWALNSASIGFLHKAAYLTQDGRWIGYRERTGLDMDVFRLGQSFWPEERLAPVPPEDLANTWQINPMPEPMWRWRNNGFELGESYLFMSYRSQPDATGDFILLDGFNGASRNPYHTFAILELRLDGTTILEGYLNQLRTKVDGITEDTIAMNAALKHHQVLGDMVVAIGEVPDAAFVNWRRTLVQRVGQYALVVDQLIPRVSTENLEVEIDWEAKHGAWKINPDVPGEVQLAGAIGLSALPPGFLDFPALEANCKSRPEGPDNLVKLESLGVILLRSKAPGDWLEMSFDLEGPFRGEVFVDLLNYKDRGAVRLYLDGKVVVDKYNHNAPEAVNAQVPFGEIELAAGEHTLRVETVDRNESMDRCYIGLAGVTLRAEGARLPERPVVCTSELVDTAVEGGRATMTWTGPVAEGRQKHFFSLVLPGGRAAACKRLDDNAAALALPAPALAVAGSYEGMEAELVIAASDHLYGKGVTRVGGMFAAEAPVEIDWDFAKGVIHIATPEPTRVGFVTSEPDSLRLDGQPWKVASREGGLAFYDLPAGRHTIETAVPSQAALDAYTARLSELGRTATAIRTQECAARAASQEPSAPPLATRAAFSFAKPIVNLEVIASEAGPLLCAAEGEAIHVLTPDGQEVRSLQADGPIRMLRWWDEHKLLLAGCADEKVIAFDQEGQRKWVFVSEMDPAVFRAAKTYWFKSEPGHEGIHGLYTGVFLDGKSQAFVGSACTLEVLDENGQLVKRMPQFWGKVSTMLIIPGQNDTLNLLAARRFNGTNTLAIINNKTLNPSPRGFYSVPPGHTHMPGWSSMNRHHVFFEDFDGDGQKEVMSEINGAWNRVTVWDANGAAKYDVSFGAGRRIPARNMRDIDIADLDGDGLNEIVVATSGRMIVALKGTCEKIWAKRIPVAPTVMNCTIPDGKSTPWIVIGCEDGSIRVLEREGALTRSAHVTGAPKRIQCFTDASGNALAAFGTDAGEVKFLALSSTK